MARSVNGVISHREPFTLEVHRCPFCGNGVGHEITPFTLEPPGGRNAGKTQSREAELARWGDCDCGGIVIKEIVLYLQSRLPRGAGIGSTQDLSGGVGEWLKPAVC